MANYYVLQATGKDTDPGTEQLPLKTIGAALQKAQANDTIYIGPGRYHEEVATSAAGQTLRAWQDNNQPIIDGKYGPHLWEQNKAYPLLFSNRASYSGWTGPNPYADTNFLPINAEYSKTFTESLVKVRHDDCKLINLTIINSAGGGISLGMTSGGLVKGCRIDFCYAGAISHGNNARVNAAGRPNNTIVEDCIITRISMKNWTDSAKHQGSKLYGKDTNDVALKPKGTDRVTMRNNIIGFTGGEGMAAAAGSNYTKIYGNTIICTGHWSLGLNCTQNVDVHNNIIINWDEAGAKSAKTESASTGIIIGDEEALYFSNKMHTENARIYNNLIVGGSKSAITLSRTGNYATVLKNIYLGHNTIVHKHTPNGTETRKAAIQIGGAQEHGGYKRELVNGEWKEIYVPIPTNHHSVLIENNIVFGYTNLHFNPSTTANIVARYNLYNNVDTAPAPFNATSNIKIAPGTENTVLPKWVNDINGTCNMGQSNHSTAFNALANVTFQALNYKPAANGKANRAASARDPITINGLQIVPPVLQANSGSHVAGDNGTGIDQDLLGNARSSPHDIGAIVASAAAPTPYVVASFSSSNNPTYNQATTFTSTSAGYNGATITGQTWTITKPDNSTETATTTTKAVTFNQTGTWSVKLAVTGSSSTANDVTQTYTITDTPATPTANFTINPFNRDFTAGDALSNKTFANTTTPKLATASYTWTILRVNQDNTRTTIATATTENYSYAFNTPGNYEIKLRATNGGAYTEVVKEARAAAPDVTCTFTQTSGGAPATGGPAPYSVTFTDTTASEAITERRWDVYGDNSQVVTQTGATYTHLYAQPGAYTPKLSITANGSTYTATGTQIVVTQPSGPTDAVYIDTIFVPIVTTGETTTQTITFNNLSGNVPKLLLFEATNATALDTATNNALYMRGISDGTNQFAIAAVTKHASATTATQRRQTAQNVLLAINDAGTVTGAAKIKSVQANAVTLEIVTQFPAAYLMKVTALAGTGIQATVGNVIGPTVTTPVTINTSHPVNLVHVLTTNTPTLDTSASTAVVSYGYATSPANQYGFRWHEAPGKAKGEPNIIHVNGLAYKNTATTSNTLTLSNLNSSSVTLSATGGDFNNPIGYYLLTSSKNIDLRRLTSPATASELTFTTSKQTNYLELTSTLAENISEPVATTSSSSFSTHTTTLAGAATSRRTHNITSEYNAAPTKTAALVVNTYAGTTTSASATTLTGLRASTTLTSTGYKLNYTTVQSSARHAIALALEASAGTSHPGPIAGFIAAPTSGRLPLTIALTNTSNTNGGGTLDYLWDFGDGTTSTEQNPTHTYDSIDNAPFTITLTVTNDNGSNTLARSKYINIELPPGPIIINPSAPLTITNDTANELRNSPDDPEELLNTHTHAIDLASVDIELNYAAGDAAEIAGRPNKLRLLYQNGVLYAVKPDGTKGTIAITWPTGSSSTTQGTVSAKINNTTNDGYQAYNGAMDTTNYTIRQNANNQYAFLRFAVTNLPQGSYITRAQLKLYAGSASSTVISNLTLYAHKSPDSPAINPAVNYAVSALPATTATVTWTEATKPLLSNPGWVTAPDLSAVIQEIAAQPTWTGSGYITLILRCNNADPANAFTFHGYEYTDGSNAAELTIDWNR